MAIISKYILLWKSIKQFSDYNEYLKKKYLKLKKLLT